MKIIAAALAIIGLGGIIANMIGKAIWEIVEDMNYQETEKEIFMFIAAQQAAEAAGENEFMCPKCGSKASWIRDAGGRMTATCSGCGIRMMG